MFLVTFYVISKDVLLTRDKAPRGLPVDTKGI